MRPIRSGRETLQVTPRRLMAGWRGELVPDAAPTPVEGCNVHPVSAAAVFQDGTALPGVTATVDYLITSRAPWPGGPYSQIVRESGEVLEQVDPPVRATLGVGTPHWQVTARRFGEEAK